ncbi:MAG: histidinol dehydrogenase [Nitrospinota bacterium]|nr:histidinol dehydrogenase [Nitrospinota bacterium]
MKKIRYKTENSRDEVRNLSLHGKIPEKVNGIPEIIQKVKENGDSALLELTRLYDGVNFPNGIIQITKEDLETGYNSLNDKIIDALTLSAKRIQEFHQLQLPQTISLMKKQSREISYVPSPLERVGLYVPGGRGAYPSTVLMNAIPAKVAGVREIILCTPPSSDGKVPDSVLVAASISGVDKIFSVGGAQSIAAMAFGTDTIPKVDKIVGPGNAYVLEAKRLVSNVVAIDKDAGPSEIVILIDETTPIDWAVADLFAQAEHDPDAMAIAVCLSEDVSVSVEKEIENQIIYQDRKEVIQKSLSSRGAIIQVDSIEDAIQVIDDIAPEHLQIMIENSAHIAERVLSAGSIFYGSWSSAVFGDYIVGINHVLPTGSSARFSSPLSVLDFIKWTNVVSLDSEYASSLVESAALLAETEGLSAHARALRIRLSKDAKTISN